MVEVFRLLVGSSYILLKKGFAIFLAKPFLYFSLLELLLCVQEH